MNTKIVAILVIIIAVLGGIWIYQSGLEEAPTANVNNSEMLEREAPYEITATMVPYYNGVEGYFASPAEEGSYPGIVMIHEWWGLNDNIKNMAQQLAGEGYNVLAVDLYNGQVAQDSTQARELVGSLDQEDAKANMMSAAEFLRNENSSRLASLGWCFGGGQSLQLALSGENLDATVIYYGSLVTNQTELSQIDWPVLGIFGEEDGSIPVETVNQFDAALDGIGVENEIYVYPGVGHAFANPSGANYAASETMDAWEKTLTFLKTHLNR